MFSDILQLFLGLIFLDSTVYILQVKSLAKQLLFIQTSSINRVLPSVSEFVIGTLLAGRDVYAVICRVADSVYVYKEQIYVSQVVSVFFIMSSPPHKGPQ